MVCMARTAQVVLIEEVTSVAAVERDVDLGRDFVICVCTWSVAAADDTDAAEWIAGKDERLGSITPLR
jgi:hypothetical protein